MADIKGSQIPVSENTQPGDMLMGVRKTAGGNTNFNLSVTALLNATNGAFMGLAEADTNPGVPVSARYYQGKAGVTYAYFKNESNTSISVPSKVGQQYVVDVRLIWNGSSWSATWGLIDEADLTDYAKKSDLNTTAIVANRAAEAVGVSSPILTRPFLSYRIYSDNTTFLTQDAKVINSATQFGYMEAAGYKNLYLNTSLVVTEKTKKINIAFKIISIDATSAIGIGFNYKGIVYRKSGTVITINPYNNTPFLTLPTYDLNDVIEFAIDFLNTTSCRISIYKNGNLLGQEILSITLGNLQIITRGQATGVIDNLVVTTEGDLQKFAKDEAKSALDSAKGYTDQQMAYLEKPKARKIVPSSNYNYYIYTGSGTGQYKRLKGWYFGKAAKKITHLGMFLYKDAALADFANPARVQVLHKRENVITRLLDKSIPTLVLNKFKTEGYSGDAKDYEYVTALDTPITLEEGDKIFWAFEVMDGITHFIGAENYNLTSGEWNDGTKAYRAGDIQNVSEGTFDDIPALPDVTGTTYVPLHFYEVEPEFDLNRVLNLEETAVKRILLQGKTVINFSLNGIPARVTTSDGYSSQGTPDTLMIICHGNGQTYATCEPDTKFKNFLAANRISFAAIQMQDQVTAPFNTKATGWGNEIALRRVIELYNHLMANYNFNKNIILCGRSMGGLSVGHLAHTMPFPIRFCLGIGPSPTIRITFQSGSETTRKQPIRQAYGMAADGTDDARLAEFTQGYDWFDKGVVIVGGVRYKHFAPHLYILVGMDDTFLNNFGGTATFLELKESINRAGGYCYYFERPSVGHDAPVLFDDSVRNGVWLKEMGIPIPSDY